MTFLAQSHFHQNPGDPSTSPSFPIKHLWVVRSSVVGHVVDPPPQFYIYSSTSQWIQQIDKLLRGLKWRDLTTVLRDSVYHGKATAPEITQNNQCEQRSHILHIWIQVCFELKRKKTPFLTRFFYPVLPSYGSRHPSTPPHSSHRMRHRPGQCLRNTKTMCTMKGTTHMKDLRVLNTKLGDAVKFNQSILYPVYQRLGF